jgi:hypothetical protein
MVMRRRSKFVKLLLAAASVGSLAMPVVLTAQSHAGNTQPKFDISRLADSEGQFETFHVTGTQPLRQALEKGVLNDDTRLLVTETAAGKLALVTDQMAFHHIAQGVAANKEWMATF